MKKALRFFLLALLLFLPIFFLIKETHNHRLLLITGCARSGTTYISKLLAEAGLRIGHERVRRNGICSWDLAVDPDEGRWNVKKGQYNFAHIFHQVRHPLKTISSVYSTEDAASWNFIMKHLKEIQPEDSHLVKCAKYWYYWNLAAERRAEWTYRIEDIATLAGEFGKHLETKSDQPLENSRCNFTWTEFITPWDKIGNQLVRKLDAAALKRIAKDTHTKGPHRDFTWADLQKEVPPELFSNICALAQRYGYTISDENP